MGIMSLNKKIELKNKYNEILNIINYDFEYEQNNLENIIDNFCNEIENQKLFSNFLNRDNNKYLQLLELLIPNLDIKKFELNNDKDYIWECMQLIYAIYYTGNKF